MPAHIKKCPSVVELKKWAKEIDAAKTPEEKQIKERDMLVSLRRSELRNSRCAQQAIRYFGKIREQQTKKKQ